MECARIVMNIIPANTDATIAITKVIQWNGF